MSGDPFRYHPDLRELIADPLTSPYRDIDVDELAERSPDPGFRDRITPEPQREAGRRALLEDHRDADLWVFAYGSLIWDPGIVFCEVRHAFAPHHQRRFILKDTRGPRGSPERPGVMAALDEGTGCHGLAFRIAKDRIEEETYRLWARERIGPAYREAMIELQLSDRTVEGVAFLADHAAEVIEPELSREHQVEFAAFGEGFRGTSFDYVDNLVTRFRRLGIDDPELFAFHSDVCARRAAQ